MTESISDQFSSIAALLEHRATTCGDLEFLRSSGHSLSFAQVAHEVDQRALKLAGAGVKPGERIALMMKNGLDFPLWWLAILRAGGIMVPINIQYEQHDLAYILEDSKPVAAICQAPYFEKLQQAAKNTAMMIFSDHVASDYQFKDLVKSNAPLPAQGRTDLANIQYTSGTTGFPKGCMLTQNYWLELGHQARSLFDMKYGDVNFTAQPFYYLDPQWNLLACLFAKIPLVIAPRFSASTFWETIVKENVTIFYCVGAMPAMLLNQQRNPLVDRAHRVRLVYCSGLSPLLHADVEERWGVPWREVFGMTETGADIAVDAADQASVGSGTIGTPLAGRTAGIFGSDNEKCAYGEIGELRIRGVPMMLGYWNNPEATRAAFVDGWFRTGDLARQDQQGKFYIVGRKKDMIRRSGENISAAEVEQILAAHPSVDIAAVKARPDMVRGEEVEAFLLLKSDREFDPLELLEFLSDKLAAFKRPRYLSILKHMPLTPSMRPQKQLLNYSDENLVLKSIDCSTFEQSGPINRRTG